MIAAILAVASWIGCSRQPVAETRNPSFAEIIPLDLPPCNEPSKNPAGEEFLPAGQMGPWKIEAQERDQQARSIYSTSLTGLGEPTMLSPRQAESYRLMIELDGWQRAAIRAEPNNIHVASVVYLPTDASQGEKADAHQAGFGPRGCRSRILSAWEWSAIRDCFEKASFWTAPTDRPPWHMFDATSLLLEARQQDRYHFVVRMSGGGLEFDSSAEPFMRCAKILVDLSGVASAGVYPFSR
jgi:hypothetical protein